MPESLDTAWRSVPVSTFLIAIEAPDTTALLGSVMRPAKLAVVVCAKTIACVTAHATKAIRIEGACIRLLLLPNVQGTATVTI